MKALLQEFSRNIFRDKSRLALGVLFIFGLVLMIKPDWLIHPATNAKKKNAVTLARMDGKDVSSFDKIQLQKDQTAEIEFDSGYVLTLIGPIDAFVESWNKNTANSPVLLHILTGDFTVKQPGTPGSVYVVQNEQMFTPEKKPQDGSQAMVIQQRVNVQDPNQKKETLAAETQKSTGKMTPDDQTLSNAFINSRIVEERAQFIRCQSNAARDRKTTQGKILVAFTITTRGQTEQVRVLQSGIKNPEFEACIQSVFQRIQFKPFGGPAITRSFPLTFE